MSVLAVLWSSTTLSIRTGSPNRDGKDVHPPPTNVERRTSRQEVLANLRMLNATD